MTVELPIPLSRAELYLAKAAGMAGITVPSPESREECYLAYMAGVDPVDVPTPASLKEQWLYLICGGVAKPLPVIEGAMLIGQQMVDTNYLAAAAGLAGAVTPASPRNRAEEYFAEIAQHGPFVRLKTVSGVSLVLNDVNHGIESLNYVYGDTFHQTYSGWQMLGGQGMATPFSDTSYWSTTSGFTQTPLQNGWARLSNTSGSSMQYANCFIKTQAQFQTSSTYTVVIELTNVEAGPRRLVFASTASSSDSIGSYQFISCPDGVTEQTDGATWYRSSGLLAGEYVLSFTTKNNLLTYLPRMFFMYPEDGKSFDMRMSIIKGDHSSDWQNYAGDNWQPYVGGTPSPNPDYPQDVQVVTGRQVVTISDGGSQSQEYEVNLGKNLFDKATATILSGAINSDLTYTSGGNARTVFIPCKPNTKYSASKITQGSRTRLGSCTGRIDTDGGSLTNYTQTYTDADSRRIVELTTGLNDKYLYFTFGQTSDIATIQSLVDSIQIEVGDATSYAPYFTPIELCKIGDYQDYIYKSGGGWYLHKAVGKTTLPTSGYTQWVNADYPDVHTLFYQNYNIADALYKSSAPSGLCKYYLTVKQHDYVSGVYDEMNGSYGFGLKVRTKGICFLNKDCTTLEEFHTWISSNPVDLYYPLATPTDTQITNQALISQLDALDSAILPSPDANVLVTGNIAGAIDFTYYATP